MTHPIWIPKTTLLTLYELKFAEVAADGVELHYGISPAIVLPHRVTVCATYLPTSGIASVD